MTTESRQFVVVDASLAVKWLIDEDYSDLAKSLAQSWAAQGIRLSAPQLLPYEVSNALHRRVVSGGITIDMASQLLDSLATRQIQLFPSNEFRVQALQLATRLNQRAIYDSHYLALAQALDCEFWTADERFYRSASPNLANIRLISEAAAPNQ